VEKPYFNLDEESRFRQLGTVANRGVEMSIAGRVVKGLTVNAGATWLDARVSGVQVEQGLIGDRPIRNFRLRTLAERELGVPVA
jgi:iron complex outermembrane recepter protein